MATIAGILPSSYVIHTVGPIYYKCGESYDELLASCYVNSLMIADKLGCKKVALPAISTVIYVYPKEKAAHIAYKAVKHFLDGKDYMEVHFAFHNNEDKEIFVEQYKKNVESAHQSIVLLR